MQTHLFVILDILVLCEDPVDDDGQDANPLILQLRIWHIEQGYDLQPPKLVENGVAKLDQLADCRALR